MNPWLQGLQETIQLQHRCESLAEGLRQKVKKYAGGAEKRHVHCTSMIIETSDPKEEAKKQTTQLHRHLCNFGTTVFPAPPPWNHQAFCLRIRWQLSFLVTSKQPWIIGFIAVLQRCPPTHRAKVEIGNDKTCTRAQHTHQQIHA